jgi:hypothetical protein
MAWFSPASTKNLPFVVVVPAYFTLGYEVNYSQAATVVFLLMIRVSIFPEPLTTSNSSIPLESVSCLSFNLSLSFAM